jgi:hypothetical protein
MTRTNILLVASLLVLALAVLARAAVISQHAYAVLLQSAMSGDELGAGTAADATDQIKSPLATIDAEPAAPLASEQEVTGEIPVGERSQAKLEVPRQMDSEIQKSAPKRRRQHHNLYNYRYSGGRFQAYWGPSVW